MPLEVWSWLTPSAMATEALRAVEQARRETAAALRAERANHGETAEALWVTQARLAELDTLRRQP